MDDDYELENAPFIEDADQNEMNFEHYECSGIVEEPDDNVSSKFESKVDATNANNDELIAEMKREDDKDEERRNGANGLRSKSAPAPRKRGKSRTKTAATQSKLERMRAKHMRSAVRDAEKILKVVSKDNENEDLRKVRIEAQHAQQQSIAALRELSALVKTNAKTKESLKQHNEMTAKLRRYLQMSEDKTATTSSIEAMHDLILSDCIEVMFAQSNVITILHDRVNKLVRLYAENTAKCEATSRKVFENSMQYASTIPILVTQNGKHNKQLPNGKTDHKSIVEPDHQQNGVTVEEVNEDEDEEKKNSALVSKPHEESVTIGKDAVFGMRTGNGFYDLSTRPAPQIIHGKPGSHYVAFSVARRKCSAQKLSQSETIRSTHNIQRLAKLSKKRKAYGELILSLPHMNGDDLIQQITEPESESLAQIEDGETPVLEPTKRKRKLLTANGSESSVKKKK